jgi:hypothetical protein
MFKNIVFQPFQIRRECGERSFVFGLWSERSDRSWTVKGAETARKGCGDVEGSKSVRLEEESRKSKPRRRGADLGIPDGRFVKNQTSKCGVKFHAWISSSTVGPRKSPRKVQVSRDVDRPVTIKARVIENFFSFREASASFQAERFFFVRIRVIGVLVTSPANSFFFCKSSCLFYSFIFCVLVRRATSFSILNLAFFLGNEVRPEGTAPPIVGGVEE